MKKEAWPKTNADVCIRCATCMAVCPVSRVTPKFPGPKQAGPGAERFRRPGDPSVDEWIDLCIGCHLCDMVCSSGVNISELNLIAKAKYLDEKGRPFRDWLLTHSYLYGWLGSFFSPLVNLLLRNSQIKWMVEAVLRLIEEENSQVMNLLPSDNGLKNTIQKVDRKSCLFLWLLYQYQRGRCRKSNGPSP